MRLFGILFRLAWRNLWRNHRRTVIMLGAIGTGVWAMIFMTALTRGMVDQMIIDSIGVMPGHVQMHNPKFADDPSVSNRIVYSNAELTDKFKDADFEAWASQCGIG